jgi:hypothetical protein
MEFVECGPLGLSSILRYCILWLNFVQTTPSDCLELEQKFWGFGFTARLIKMFQRSPAAGIGGQTSKNSAEAGKMEIFHSRGSVAPTAAIFVRFSSPRLTVKLRLLPKLADRQSSVSWTKCVSNFGARGHVIPTENIL